MHRIVRRHFEVKGHASLQNVGHTRIELLRHQRSETASQSTHRRIADIGHQRASQRSRATKPGDALEAPALVYQRSIGLLHVRSRNAASILGSFIVMRFANLAAYKVVVVATIKLQLEQYPVIRRDNIRYGPNRTGVRPIGMFGEVGTNYNSRTDRDFAEAEEANTRNNRAKRQCWVTLAIPRRRIGNVQVRNSAADRTFRVWHLNRAISSDER